MTPSLGERMSSNLEALRLLLKEYHLSSQAEQSETRHYLYQKHGDFAKHLKAVVFDKFKELEEKHGPVTSKP
jgi:hypothetical protein